MKKLFTIAAVILATTISALAEDVSFSYSTTWNTIYKSCNLSYAFDGDMSTKYWTELRAGSNSNHTVIKQGDYLEVAFEKAVSLSEIVFHQGTTDKFSNVWDLRISADGENWKTVGTFGTGESINETFVSKFDLSTFTEASSVKYFRVYATQAKEYDKWIQVYEITWTVGTPTAINTINAPAKANIIKTIGDGKVVIIRDGVKYDLSGRKL